MLQLSIQYMYLTILFLLYFGSLECYGFFHITTVHTRRSDYGAPFVLVLLSIKFL